MSSRIAYNSKEVELLARLIKAEALGEGQEGMLLVGMLSLIVLLLFVMYLKMLLLLRKQFIRKMLLLELEQIYLMDLLIPKKKN